VRACHEDGGLLAGGRIAACGRDVLRGARCRHQRWRGGFLVPGMVDTHVHFPQLRIIGAMGRSLLEWLDAVALPEEARMASLAYARETAAQFVHALASHGTTTALVFGSHFPAATAELFDAASASGLRIISGLVLSDRLLRPELHMEPNRALAESAALIERYHGRGRLRYAVTPRFAVSTSDAMLEVCGELLSAHPDVRLQTHINENAAEILEVQRLFPWAADYLAVYERYGLTGRRSVMAHNVHTTAAQIARLAVSGSAVAHCPSSNVALASGRFPLKQHVEAGIRCALGTDVGGGLGFGLLKEALHAYLLQRLAVDPQPLDAPAPTWRRVRGGRQTSHRGRRFPPAGRGFQYLRPPAGSVLEIVVTARHRACADVALHSCGRRERARGACRRRHRVRKRGLMASSERGCVIDH
jgi:guanine deaminase